MATDSGDDVNKPIVEVIDSSVTYIIRNGATASLKESIIQSIKRKSHDIEIPALKNISFNVSAGEVLAIIGHNGAGKSTLLKLLARVLPPTSGRVIIRGKVSPMIELGAGFNGDLTGFENIVLYGTLLGRSPGEMRDRAKSIARWAELEDSIDWPLRTFSTGMIARLAFAIASDSFSDLVLIDEVLSVGDAEFQKKSFLRMNEMINSQSAVILVTHDMEVARKISKKALWIDHGRIIKYGDVNSVIDAYSNA